MYHKLACFLLARYILQDETKAATAAVALTVLAVWRVQYQQDYLSVGPPVYFVIRDGVNYSQTDVQNRICSTVNCDTNSVGTQITLAAQQPDR